MPQEEINVKELRENFPEVRTKLGLGTKFKLTYRNKPLAMIKPIRNQKTKKELIAERIKKVNELAGSLKIPGNVSLTAEEMDNIADEQYERVLSGLKRNN